MLEELTYDGFQSVVGFLKARSSTYRYGQKTRHVEGKTLRVIVPIEIEAVKDAGIA